MKSVLDKFSLLDKEEIDSLSSEDKLMLITRINEMGLKDTLLPISAKITKECSHMTRNELYDLGHKEKGPWDSVYNNKDDDTNIIPDHLMMV